MGFLFSKPKKEKTDNLQHNSGDVKNIKNSIIEDETDKLQQDSKDVKEQIKNLKIKDKTVNIDKQDCKIILTFSTNLLARQWTNYLINMFMEAQGGTFEKCIDEHFDINIDGKQVVFSIDKTDNCKNSQFVFNKCKKHFDKITSNSEIVIDDKIYKKIRLTTPPDIQIIKDSIDGLKKSVTDLTGGKNKYIKNKHKYLHLLNQNRF